LLRPAACSLQSGLDLVKNMRKVPPQVSVFFRGRILKSVNFFQKQFPRIDSGKKNSAAACSKVNRDIK
jgi:hypothetical protein